MLKTLGLAIKNLSSKKIRTVLNITAIVISMSTLFVFMSLADGIKAETLNSRFSETPLTQIKVRPIPKESSVFQIFSKKTNLLSDKDLAKINAVPGVKKINQETQYRNVASIEMSLLGQSFITDTMILGVPHDFIKDDTSKKAKEWKNPSEPIPVIISNKLINLYNYSIANSSHLPGIKKEFLIGSKMNIRLNYSSFFPQQQDSEKNVEAVIVGVSDKVSFLGITAPEQLVHKWNKELYSDYTNTYLEIFVETESAEQTVKTAQAIEELGYQTNYIQKDLGSIEKNFLYLKLVLSLISFIIIFTAAISIANTFLAAVTERRREIGILRAIGATRSNILMLFLQEAAIIGLIGGIISVFLGFLVNAGLDSLLIGNIEEFGAEITSLFKVSFELISFTIVFSILMSMLAASIPAYKAAKLHPIEALRK